MVSVVLDSWVGMDGDLGWFIAGFGAVRRFGEVGILALGNKVGIGGVSPMAVLQTSECQAECNYE